MNYKIFDFQVYGDERGNLLPIEGNIDIPFEIKRVYCIYDTKPEVIRGEHAHSTLEQVIVCLHGSCTFILDDGENKEEVHLYRPDKALYIGKNMWRSMHDFAYGSVLMVLANEHFNNEEYIRNYNDFLESLNND